MMNKILLFIAFALAAFGSASAQDAIKIDNFDASNFHFETVNEQFHIVEASSDLNNWVIVGHYFGDGSKVYFEDCRHNKKQEFQAYRIVFQKALFKGLYDRNWVLKSINENGEKITPAKNKVHSISFSISGRVTGNNDCNRYFGQFELNKGNCIIFPNGFASTLMFCMPQSLDEKFFSSLRQSKGFEIGEKLKIYFGDQSKNWMIFEAIDDE